MEGRRQSFTSDGARQQGHGALPRTVDGVRCGSCGAHTPVLGVDPHCLYCSMPVALPNDVAERAREVERNLARAREEARQTDRELDSEGAGYAKLIMAVQLISLLVAMGFWRDILQRTGQTPSGLQGMFLACSLLGPMLLWAIAQHLRISSELRDYAKMTFARLEVQPHATGQQLVLGCSGCGGAIDSTKIQGLSIRCTHCDNAMLAPAALVDEGQRSYLQQVLALRARMERKTYTREIFLCAAGLAYLLTFAWAGKDMEKISDPATLWAVVTFFFSFSIGVFWIATRSADDIWDFLAAGSFVLAFPLAMVMCFVAIYADVIGVKTFLN